MTNQIKTIQLYTGTWVFVEVPKGQSYFDLFGDNKNQWLLYNVMTMPGKFKPVTIPLPAGFTYTLIGKAESLSEDQWKQISQEMKVGNRWPNHNGDYPIWWHSAKESGKSLLKSQGMDIQSCVILKQND